jgi:hypothetical protein
LNGAAAVRAQECRVDGLDALRIDNGLLGALVVPELGAKILSLVDLATGREWMARSRRRLVRPPYGARYAAYDRSGWDECFPGIGEGPYPEHPWAGVVVPDHGELWTLPWRTELVDGVLRQHSHGVRFPYAFERRIDFRGGDRLAFAYAVESHAALPFKALWSAHPMLAASAATRVRLPDGVRVRVDSSRGERLGGYLAEHAWPRTRDAGGRDVALDLMGPPDQAHVDKLFSTAVPAGWCALHDEETDDFFAFAFSPDEVPFVGLAMIRGGWPSDADRDLIAVLEPCNGWPDRLDVAIARGACREVPPGGRLTWRLEVRVGRGRERLEAVVAEERS